ncbi:DUF4435 domain-containing protein [Aeromonas hydrophila]|uniref:DUF4435 domain-containing protein n=1 Tax=Aeromonas hydrophila TaxID=644 RepID=UPI0023656C3D|nr:DUF4435 domain-containing protein [Aeromonas hydrophila]WDF91724.1 DUF4435 domain-containing protein [Aeromonas hydrophila subsp. hydrophila]
MSVIKGASFPISSDMLTATNSLFTFSNLISVYVEGFDDIPIWNKILKGKLNVKIMAFGEKNKANGKASIISEIKTGGIILGKDLIVALDSDYDYLLNKNSETFSLPTVLQTYSYSIENLIWHPENIDSACQTAGQDTTYFTNDGLKKSLLQWSADIYEPFLRFIKNGAADESAISDIIESLVVDTTAFTIKFHGNKECYDDPDFKVIMAEKGLIPETTFLFVRGHDYAKKLESLCEQLNEEVFRRRKASIIEKKKDDTEDVGQLIQEAKNAQLKPGVVIKGSSLTCNICLPKIDNDINTFINYAR